MARNIPVRKKKAPFPSQGLGYVFFGWSTLGKLHPLTDVSYANARLEPATPAHVLGRLMQRLAPATVDPKGKQAEKNQDASHTGNAEPAG